VITKYQRLKGCIINYYIYVAVLNRMLLTMQQKVLRSKSEKISDILRSVHSCTGSRKSQIMYETFIPYNQLKEHLAVMIQNELIVYVKEDKTFKITEYGIHVLELYDEMDKLLVYNPTRLNYH
jgi:predicted transcriptional regulator